MSKTPHQNRTPRAKSGNEPLPSVTQHDNFSPQLTTSWKKKLPCFNPEDFERLSRKKHPKKILIRWFKPWPFHPQTWEVTIHPQRSRFRRIARYLGGFLFFKKKKDSGTPSLKYLIFRRSLPRSWSIFLLPALLTAGQQTLVYQRAKKTDLR